MKIKNTNLSNFATLRTILFSFFLVEIATTSFGQSPEFDNDKPAKTYNTGYSQSFTDAWDNVKFYAQWVAMDANIFTSADIAKSYLQFVWSPKRIIMSKTDYSSPYIFQAEVAYGDDSNRGGVVIRANPEKIDQVQEPAGGDPGFNREGIAFYPTLDGLKMIVQFTGVFNDDATIATRIEVPKPDNVESFLNKGILRIEDFDTTIYVYYNDAAFARIDFGPREGPLYTSGTVFDAYMNSMGTFSKMEVEVTGKLSIAQRNALLRLYTVSIKSNELEKQTIIFEPIGTKLITDEPFVLSASASSGLPVEFSVKKGPATIKADTVFLKGEVGLVEIAANQLGNDQYARAPEVIQPFFVQVDTTSTSEDLSNFNDNWVVTDGADRKMIDFEEVGARRDGKIVGVFYYLWQGFHGNKIHDITKIIAAYPQDPLSSSNPGWGGVGEFHFWGEPEEGYFKALDPWVIRRNLQMLSNADVDFIFFDVTNAVTYLDEVFALCDMSVKMRSEGIKTPEIAFITYSNSGFVINSLYDNFYAIGAYQNLWFKWQGKPLILGKADDPALRQEVKNFFTIKFSWAWTNSKTEPNHWQWLDSYPQDWGWSTDPNVPEQLSVSVAHHPSNPLGKSYSNGEEPPVDKDYLTEFTGLGLQFQEQWSRAFEVDPQAVMVTQWNEWIAQRFIQENNGSYGGKPIKKGDTYFVDMFNSEFNRDIAPMKGGYTDNYYYQLVSNIRKFKGMDKPSVISAPNSISVNGDFSDWAAVTPVFKDAPGDILHRNYPAYDPAITYTNNTGRNDIIESRTTFDIDSLYFYVKTNENISPETDANWMLLFIDADRNKGTGWEGYDFVVNHGVTSENQTTVKAWDGKIWADLSTANCRKMGKEMEISLSRAALGMDKATPEFYFHWADNPQQLNDITAFFMDGESAPDRRFNYNFSTSKLAEKVQSPFKTMDIPGTIEFEDFDNGGSGIAYADADIANQGGKYRPEESVDIADKTGGGFYVGWTNKNEWLEYTANVKSIGKFSVKINYSAALGGSKVLLLINGVAKSDTILLPSTGGATDWGSKEIEMQLTAGTQTFKLLIVDAPGELRLDKLEFAEKEVVYPGTGTGLNMSLWKGKVGGREWFVDSICGKLDPQIDEVWEDVSPGCGIDKDFWNARWEGQIEALFTENFTFYLTANDMSKLWVNGKLVIDGWVSTSSGKTLSGTIDLVAGEKVDIKLDFAEKSGDAMVKLEWESAKNEREVVPFTQLYPKIPTGINSFQNAENQINVYPNPSTGEFTIDAGNSMVKSFSLVDLQGRTVFFSNEEFAGLKTIKSNFIQSGIYFLQLNGKDFKQVEKIVLN